MMHDYEPRLYSKIIKNKRKSYFIDFQESSQGNLYIRLTEASNSKKSSIVIFVYDIAKFAKELKATFASDGLDVKKVVLSKETITMVKVENSDAADFSIMITKEDENGRTRRVYLLEVEMEKILHEIDHISGMHEEAKET